jgi:hypothetical protein
MSGIPTKTAVSVVSITPEIAREPAVPSPDDDIIGKTVWAINSMAGITVVIMSAKKKVIATKNCIALIILTIIRPLRETQRLLL